MNQDDACLDEASTANDAECTVDAMPQGGELVESATASLGEVIPMIDFIQSFGDGLLDSVRTINPPVYDGTPHVRRREVLKQLTRQPFEAQSQMVECATQLLIDRQSPACIFNAEMGTGKTMMAIATAAVMHEEGFQRTLVISPPHLVYKWRREIKQTVANARVWVLNGPDTLRKLLMIRQHMAKPKSPEFFVLGRVRMRLGFHWRPAFTARRLVVDGDPLVFAACPACGSVITQAGGEGSPYPLSLEEAAGYLSRERRFCEAPTTSGTCGSALWTLMHKRPPQHDRRKLVSDALQQMPTIGPKRAEQLIAAFGDELLSSMLEDNIYEFVNLMDEDGDLVFSDRQAARIERALATFEFAVGQGGYQPTEFIKRYLPQGFFGLLVVDEGHEYKNGGSAQGQAMGVLARKCRRTLLLTGTLMGGYADDLFHLLWRLNPKAMIEDGFRPNKRNSMSNAVMDFMREHGVLKDIYKETEARSHRTSKGKQITHRVAKAPGFGPKGIMRFLLPYTAFLRLKDIGSNVLPPYKEEFTEIEMTDGQAEAYTKMALTLARILKAALRAGDHSLLGVVLNVLLAWPDCAFRDELVKHPRSRQQIYFQPAVFSIDDVSPKEAALIDLCKAQKALHRRVLAYTVYTGTRDTTARLRVKLEAEGFRVAVLRASIDASRREDWVAEQVDRGIDVLLTNPELVKTGLDLLEFPTVVFLQSGYNVYTLQQAARRSWRIGQTQSVEVHFLGYARTAQMDCLRLMAAKIAVSQSTSGDMPESGLDILNQSSDSVEVALAKQLIG